MLLRQFHRRLLPCPPNPPPDPPSDLYHQRWISEPLPWNLTPGSLLHHPPPPPNHRPNRPDPARRNSGFFGKPEIVDARENRLPVYPSLTLPGKRNRITGPDIIEDVLRIRIQDAEADAPSRSGKSQKNPGTGSDVIQTRHRYLKKSSGNNVEALRELSLHQTGNNTCAETGSRGLADGIHFRGGASLGGVKQVAEKRKLEKENRLNQSLKPEVRQLYDGSECIVTSGRLSRSFGDVRSGDLDPGSDFDPIYENGCMEELLRRHSLSIACLTGDLLTREVMTPKADTSVMNWDSLQKTLTIGCKNGRPEQRPKNPTIFDHQLKRNSLSNLSSEGHLKVRRRLFEVSSETSLVEDMLRPLQGANVPWIDRRGSPESVVMNVDWDCGESRKVMTLGKNRIEGRDILYANNDLIYDSIMNSSKNRIDPQLDNTYDTIGDLSLPESSSRSPPPLPPPKLPTRNRRSRESVPPPRPNKDPGCPNPEQSRPTIHGFESEIVDINAQHIYTISDVLENLRRLADHLPKATESIEGLCHQAAWLQPEIGGVVNSKQERSRSGSRCEFTGNERVLKPEVEHSQIDPTRRSRSKSPGVKNLEVKAEIYIDLFNTTSSRSRNSSLSRSKKYKVVQGDDKVTDQSSFSTLTKKLSDRNSKFRKLVVKTKEPQSLKDELDKRVAEPAGKTDPDQSTTTTYETSDWYQRFPLKKLFSRIQNREKRRSRKQNFYHQDGSNFDDGTIPKPSHNNIPDLTIDPKLLTDSRRSSSADRLEVTRNPECSGKSLSRKDSKLDRSMESRFKDLKIASNPSILEPRFKTGSKDLDLPNHQRSSSNSTKTPRIPNPGKLKWVRVGAAEEIFC